MIPKASQRGGGQHLATHLLNAFDNDSVELAHLSGAVAPDLHGAFAEWRATSKATKCRKYLYSLSVNPDPRQGALKRDLYYEFIERAEKALGLTGQPRAVVFHVKHGREHCHVVWSRIDTHKLRAVQLSHDRQTLRTVARQFARDHKLLLPAGMLQDRGADRFKDRRQRENLGEQQQEERTGITKQQRMQEITQVWRETKDGASLVRGLEERGYYLARGDRRAYVIVDRGGEIHSLPKQIMDANTADVKARLADYPVDKLPDAKQAQEFARARRAELVSSHPAADPAQSPQARHEALEAVHKPRRDVLDGRRDVLLRQHAAEEAALREIHDAANKGIAVSRFPGQRKGLLGFLARITGVRLLIESRHRRQDVKREAVQQNEREALARRHQREMADFRHFDAALASVEKRERRSLETMIRREAFRSAVRGGAGDSRSQQKSTTLSPAVRSAAEDFRRAAARKQESRTKSASKLSRAFEDAAKADKPSEPGKPPAERSREQDKPGTMRGEFGEAAKDKDPLTSAEALRDALKKEQERQQEQKQKPKPGDRDRDFER